MQVSASMMIGITAVCILTKAQAISNKIRQTSPIVALANTQFYNGIIFAAGNGNLMVLDYELNVLHNIITCEDGKVPCDNVNKILLIKEDTDELIMCGTGYQGTCQIRPLDNIETIRYISTETIVSADAMRPAAGIVTQQGHFLLGVTFGENLSFNYKTISNRILKSDNSTAVFETIQQLNIDRSKFFHDYLIYFKKGFHINEFSYFVTNQKRYVGDTSYVSKLVRVCQNDTSRLFNSYTDVELSCVRDGVSYNLIQDTVVVNSPDYGSIFIAAFTNGRNPETPSGDSVICYSTMDLLDYAILQAKKDFVTCNNQLSDDERYLRKDLVECLSTILFQEYLFTCSTAIPTFKYVIGVTPVNLTLGYSLSPSEGYITALSSRIVGGNNIDIHAGTSMGNIIKMHLFGVNNSLVPYEEQRIGLHPISAIYTENLDYYVMTTSMVYKYKETDCSEYKTCQDTMTGRNPLCGWCVYNNRSTQLLDCSEANDHWLTSTGQCISLLIQPKGKYIYQAQLKVVLNVTNLLISTANRTYYCKYKLDEGYIDNDTEYTVEDEGRGIFTCLTPNRTVHTASSLELWTSSTNYGNPNILLAQTSFLFYDCSLYITCGLCTKSPYADCQWCGDSRTCQTPTSACNSQLIQDYDSCPQLLASTDYFIPDGIETTVIITAKNLDTSNGIKYECITSHVDLVSDALNWTETSVQCRIKIDNRYPEGKEEYKLSVRYGNDSDVMVNLDDVHYTTVIVYKCEYIAHDCTRCGALNAARYNCGWCNNFDSCIYNSSVCSLTPNCPPPNITKIIPRNGPRQGGTLVTMYGTDLGVSLSDIKNIQIGSIDCMDFRVVLNHHYQDFSQFIESIVCQTGILSKDIYLGEFAPVSIHVGTQIGSSMVLFTYQVLTISSINPKYGIVSGGIHVTIYGQHFGIGNREVKVMFGSELVNAKLDPFFPPEIDADGINFTIQFITPENLTDDVTLLAILDTYGVELANTTIAYTVIADPVITQILPKRGFLSGGTIITIDGEGFNNVHMTTLALVDVTDTLKQKCWIENSTTTVCKVPAYTDYLQDVDYTDYDDDFIVVSMILALDGVMEQFHFQYHLDPVFDVLDNNRNDTENNVVTISPGEDLTIQGKRLHSIAKETDITVTIGMDECVITNITNTNITCTPPVISPQPGIPGVIYPEINVTVGNIRVTVGYLKYVVHVVTESTNITTIALSVGISVGVVIIAAIIGMCVFRRTGKRFKSLRKETTNQQTQMNRMEVMLKATQEKLEAVENELTAERYVDIDDVARSGHYEETDTYETIEDNGYLTCTNEAGTSGYLTPIDSTNGYQKRTNEARTSGYLTPIERQGQPIDYMSFDINADVYVQGRIANNGTDNTPDATDIVGRSNDYVNAENYRE